MRYFLTLIAMLGAALLAPAAALAQPYEELGRSYEFGGHGGGYFEQVCDRNEVLAGVRVMAGKDLNALWGVCQDMADDHPTGATRQLGAVGSINGTSGGAMCPDALVEGMRVETSNVNLVHRVVLVCRLFSGGRREIELSADAFGGDRIEGGEAARSELADCGPDSYAIGIFGKYGANIDSLGLICGKSARIANPPPPLVNDANGNGRTGPAPVDNGDDTADDNGNGGGDQGGGGNDGTFPGKVNQPSAIYERPGDGWLMDLETGTSVTIIECKQESENFCHVSEPRNGYVYEPELDY